MRLVVIYKIKRIGRNDFDNWMVYFWGFSTTGIAKGRTLFLAIKRALT